MLPEKTIFVNKALFNTVCVILLKKNANIQFQKQNQLYSHLAVAKPAIFILLQQNSPYPILCVCFFLEN